MGSLGPYELNAVILGDCLEKMGPIPDNSIDSILCDPPYGLGDDPDTADLLHHWLNDKDYDTGPGFMSRDWDVVPGPAVWRECYRVLKPGGCLMAFGGTRTCDLLSIAIRLAGFQRFDQIVWIHGQGFGKGIAIDKGIDSLLGKAGEREVIGYKTSPDGRNYANESNALKGLCQGISFPVGQSLEKLTITAPATEAAALWSGYRSQLKPAHEAILCFWKPRESTFAKNALKWGVSGLWIDGCRIAVDEDDYDAQKAKQHKRTMGKDRHNTVFGTGIRQYEPSTLGRFPSNVLISHHPDCVRVGVKQVKIETGPKGTIRKYPNAFKAKEHGTERPSYIDPDGLEAVPDYRCHPDCAVLQLDRQAGVRKSGSGNKSHPKSNRYGGSSLLPSKTKGDGKHWAGDSGSASRFYYTPKAPPREKWFYCEICDDCYPYAQRDDHAHGKPKGQRKHQIAHPTVKPLAINNYLFGVLEYLCRLTKTPTGGIVLDPFGGSGTTALAAMANGRDFLLIENDPIYHRIAEKRIEQAMKEPRQLELL